MPIPCFTCFGDRMRDGIAGGLQDKVGQLFSLIWDWTLGWPTDHLLLRRNAQLLDTEMRELKAMMEDIGRKVRCGEAQQPYMERQSLVEEWLKMGRKLETQVSEFQAAHQRQSYFSIIITGFCLGRAASDLLKEVRKLKALLGTVSAEVVTRVLPPGVEEVPGKPVSSIVGGEETLSKLTGYLSDPTVTIIGVWGMAGIGKTTLLKQINHRLCAAGVDAGVKFDVVVWVTVKKDRNILAIQKAIGKRIGLALAEDNSGADEAQLADHLRKSLSKKRFLLFLDDVWERLDLEQVGIPYPSRDNGCKILLTTRSEYVCTHMDAKKVKVSLLDGDQSWELFRRSASDSPALDNPSIRPIAINVVEQCGRLPLALVTVGRAMANKKLLLEWRNAAKSLQDNAKELLGMEDDVFKPLKFSFDELSSDTLRSCLLYCSLFPEDHEIDTQQLVEYWIGEDFIDGRDIDMGIARGKGLDLIRDLQAACLLESGIDDEGNVKLHDAVRDMAQWLTSGSVPGYTDVFMVPGYTNVFTASMKLLSLVFVHGLTLAKLQAALRSMKSLQTLHLYSCERLEELQFRGDQTESLESLELKYLPLTRVVVANAALVCLQRLELEQCNSLRDITWAGRLPCLKSVSVGWCDNMEELLVAGEDATGSTVEDDVYFPMLRTIKLVRLPMLRSIVPRRLLLPSLESIRVDCCWELKKLPLGAGSASRMRLIWGDQKWWDGLEWEDETIKSQLIPRFVDPFAVTMN